MGNKSVRGLLRLEDINGNACFILRTGPTSPSTAMFSSSCARCPLALFLVGNWRRPCGHRLSRRGLMSAPLVWARGFAPCRAGRSPASTRHRRHPEGSRVHCRRLAGPKADAPPPIQLWKPRTSVRGIWRIGRMGLSPGRPRHGESKQPFDRLFVLIWNFCKLLELLLVLAANITA